MRAYELNEKYERSSITPDLNSFLSFISYRSPRWEAQLNAYLECVKKASIKAASSKATWEELASEGGRDPLETLAAGREVG